MRGLTKVKVIQTLSERKCDLPAVFPTVLSALKAAAWNPFKSVYASLKNVV